MTARKMLPRLVLCAVVFIVLLASIPLMTLAFGSISTSRDWRTASHRPSGLAPDPAVEQGAVVQVYSARTFGWRGAFAVHTWLAAKEPGADLYTRYEVIGWYSRMGHSAVSVTNTRTPDTEWFSAAPQLIRDLRGADAQAVIDKLPAAVASYPHPDLYRAWPGPNSNTFVATALRAVPELHVALPPTAIGKDFRADLSVFGMTPSETGLELEIFGLLGLKAGWVEGIELNMLTLVAGIDIRRPALKLPGIGRIGVDAVASARATGAR